MIKSEKQRLLAEFQDVTPEGLQIGEGAIKTSEGVVRVPRAKAGMKQRHAETQNNVSKPAAKPKVATTYEKVLFSTDMGEITGVYDPVIMSGDFIVLGLTDASFVPKSYREASSLRLLMQHRDMKAYVVYTGCRFREPSLDREYIVLMKTGEPDAEKTKQ